MNAAALIGLWKDLLGDGPRSGGLDRRRLLPAASLDLFACVFWPEAQPGVLVEVRGEGRVARERLPVCRGLRMSLEAAPGRQTIVVALEDSRLVEVFAVLTADLLTAAATAATSIEAGVRRCLDRMAMWQSLLDALPAEGLSPEAQRGLIGELSVLEAVHLDPLIAVSSWQGPDRAHQDFDTDGVAVEVKTSLAKRHARLRITSEKQLDDGPLSALFLAHVALSASAAGQSLAQVVNSVRGRLGHDQAALNAFEVRLLASSYLDLHEPVYRDERYVVELLRFFVVRDAFPRLIAAGLPPGVGDISYTIIADDLAGFEVELDNVKTRLEAVNG